MFAVAVTWLLLTAGCATGPLFCCECVEVYFKGIFVFLRLAEMSRRAGREWCFGLRCGEWNYLES